MLNRELLLRSSAHLKRTGIKLLGLAIRWQTRQFEIKVADSDDEYRQIHALNYETYVRELRQEDGIVDQTELVDKFHDTNVYFIAKKGSEVAAMISITLPQYHFSIEDSLSDLSVLDGIRDQCIEIRRLAIKKEYRHRKIMLRLYEFGFRYCEERGLNHMILSAIDSQRKTYRRLGAYEVGEPFTKGACTYYPMMNSLATIRSPAVDKTQLRLN